MTLKVPNQHPLHCDDIGYDVHELCPWHEDFVDEDTGEVVSIARNEIVLDRDTEIDKDNVEEIIDIFANSALSYFILIIGQL